MTSLDFFNWPNPSSRTMALWSTHPLTEISTRNLPVCVCVGGGVKDGRRVRLTSPPSVSRLFRKCGKPRRLNKLKAPTACHRDSFTVLISVTGLKPNPLSILLRTARSETRTLTHIEILLDRYFSVTKTAPYPCCCNCISL
jgi:hypothetical protein